MAAPASITQWKLNKFPNQKTESMPSNKKCRALYSDSAHSLWQFQAACVETLHQDAGNVTRALSALCLCTVRSAKSHYGTTKWVPMVRSIWTNSCPHWFSCDKDIAVQKWKGFTLVDDFIGLANQLAAGTSISGSCVRRAWSRALMGKLIGLPIVRPGPLVDDTSLPPQKRPRREPALGDIRATVATSVSAQYPQLGTKMRYSKARSQLMTCPTKPKSNCAWKGVRLPPSFYRARPQVPLLFSTGQFQGVVQFERQCISQWVLSRQHIKFHCSFPHAARVALWVKQRNLCSCLCGSHTPTPSISIVLGKGSLENGSHWQVWFFSGYLGTARLRWQ